MKGWEGPMAEAIEKQIWANGRTFWRVPFSTEVEYFYGSGASGKARCRDLSRGGLSMTLGRYLTPGRKVLLRVFSTWNPNEAAEFKGRIVWCRPTERPEWFRAGVEILRDVPEVLEDLSRLILEAATAYAGESGQRAAKGSGKEMRTPAQYRPRSHARGLAYAVLISPRVSASTTLAARSGE